LTRLRFHAEVNPPTREFDALPSAAEITFVPLEDVCPPPRWHPERTRPKEELLSGYTRFRGGDILVPKITPTFEAGRSVIAHNMETSVAAGTTELHVVRALRGDARYLNYCFQSRPFLLAGEASMVGVAGQKRVPEGWLRDYDIPVEDSRSQEKIADFLDVETSRIDALIVKKQRMIGLLVDRRDRLLDQLALPGFAPGLRKLPDDVPLSEELPTGWRAIPIGALLHRITYGFTNPMPTADEGPYMLTANDIADGRVNYENARRTTLDAFLHDLTDKSRPKRGDVLLTKDGTLGRCALFDGPDACVNQSVAVLTPRKDRIAPELLALLLTVPAYREALVFRAGGSTIKHLYITRVIKQRLGIPEWGAQKALARQLEGVHDWFRRTTGTIERQIELLREHRQSLITAAVAGRLPCRKAAA
jgi:type I restriction enzyme S subunit